MFLSVDVKKIDVAKITVLKLYRNKMVWKEAWVVWVESVMCISYVYSVYIKGTKYFVNIQLLIA